MRATKPSLEVGSSLGEAGSCEGVSEDSCRGGALVNPERFESSRILAHKLVTGKLKSP